MTNLRKRDIIEEAARVMGDERERIEEFLPCKIILHLPPAEGGDRVVMEIQAKFKPNKTT